MKIKQRKNVDEFKTAGKRCDRRKNACKFVHSAVQKFYMNNVRLLSLIRTKRCDIWLVRDTSLLQKSCNDSPHCNINTSPITCSSLYLYYRIYRVWCFLTCMYCGEKYSRTTEKSLCVVFN